MPGHNCPPAVEKFVRDLDKTVGVIATVVLVAVAVVLWRWILISLGALVVGAGIGYLGVRRWRRVQREQIAAEIQQRAAVGAAAWRPVGQPQQQAVDGGQHIHLHGADAVAELARMIQRRGHDA